MLLRLSLLSVLSIFQNKAFCQQTQSPLTAFNSNDNPLCGSGVDVRLPPSMVAEPNSNTAWTGAPSGWLYGNWKIAWSSNPLYQLFWNPEFDNSPYFPQHKDSNEITNDLATWNAQCEDDTKIYSIFLHDTERTRGSFVFDTKATGPISNMTNTWELMARGYDTEGVGYIFLYEDAPTTGGLANICFEVRQLGHPTEETRNAVLETVRSFNVPELSNLADRIVPLQHDGRRNGLFPFPCDEACANNIYYAEAVKATMEEFERCSR